MLCGMPYIIFGEQCHVCKGMWYAGVQERLLQLHKWPHGFGMEMGWFFKAAHSIARILEKHIRTACEQGISPEEHVCSLRAGPR